MLRFRLTLPLLVLLAGCGNEVVVIGTGGGDATSSKATTGATSPTSSVASATSTGTGDPGDCDTDGDCVPPTDCVVGHCFAHTCSFEPAPDGSACEDGLFCSAGDACISGKCAPGGLLPCPPPPGGGQCFVAICDEASKGCMLIPGNEGLPCQSFDACVENAVCDDGACKGEPLDCSALDAGCTKGVCDPMAGGCVAVPQPNGAICDDGDPCTSNTTCNGGVCGGGTGPVVFFADDFHSASNGWTLGNEWQIGPAMASPPTNPFGPDPAMDHTTTNDNGVAGIVIGGNASPALHPFSYLTSPAFAAPGPTVKLRFQRWLNSDYDPWMHNTIDVWNGSAWITVFASGGPPGIQDNAWTPQEIDLSMYANPAMRIRFGMDVAQGGAFTVSSWNLDDVFVASAFCP